MAPVASPVLSATAQKAIAVPPRPTDPPSQTDFATAFVFQKELIDTYRRAPAPFSQEDLVNGFDYGTQMALLSVATHQNVTPAYFEGAIGNLARTIEALRQELQLVKQEVQTIKQDVQTVKQDAQTVKQDVQTVKQDVQTVKQEARVTKQDLTRMIGKAARVSTLLHNQLRSTGSEERFEVVPFVNGDDPTQAPHNLPSINSRDAILTLSDEHIRKYYKGYYPDGTHRNAETRREKIKHAIGMRDI